MSKQITKCGKKPISFLSISHLTVRDVLKKLRPRLMLRNNSGEIHQVRWWLKHESLEELRAEAGYSENIYRDKKVQIERDIGPDWAYCTIYDEVESATESKESEMAKSDAIFNQYLDQWGSAGPDEVYVPA